MYDYMWNQGFGGGPWSMMGPWGGLFVGPFMLLLIVWSLYWKFHALWHAAKNDEKWWFIALMVVNTLGILEILYLYFFSQKPLKHDEKNVPMIPPQS